MSEPCRCERADAIKSLVSISRIVEKVSGERDAALAEVALLQEAPRGKAKCSCDMGPTSDGPEQDCPEHGDVRWYAAWLEGTSEALAEARATLAKVAAIVADPDAALVVDRIRGVLEPTKGTKP